MTPNLVINNLMQQYSGGVQFGREYVQLSVEESMHNTGFLGSLKIVEINSNNEIKMEAPACVAAPRVNMVALNRIELGLQGQNNQPVPIRFFIPEKFSLSAKEIVLGKVHFLCKPNTATISCEKLKLIIFGQEGQENIDTVKSWLTNQCTNLEIIQKR